MSRVQDGDAQAFAALYARHRRPVLAVAYRILREHAAAEDTAQETFATVWRKSGLYRPERGSVRGWILRMAQNRAIDAVRRERARPILEQTAEHETREALERVEEEVNRREEALTLRAALRELPGHQGMAIRLAYFDGFTHDQIATALDVPLGTIKSRIRLGLIRMRREVAALAPNRS